MPFDAMPMNKDAAILRRAANEIRTRGHAKNNIMTADGRVCLMGAINLARTGESSCIAYDINDRSRVLAGKVADFLNLPQQYNWDDLLPPVERAHSAVNWNDKDERTADEVIAALEGTATAIEQKEFAHAV